MTTNTRNIQSKIDNLKTKLESEKNRSEKKIIQLMNKLSELYEKQYGIRKGDKVKISSVTVRDIHRDSDLEILGKVGTVVKVESYDITVKLDGDAGNFQLSVSSVKRINR